MASRLQEMIHTQCIGMVVHAGGLPIKELIPYSSDALTCDGFSADQAILPLDSRSFDGYRLLHEYFSFPERHRFLAINGLQRALPLLTGNRFEVVVLLKSSNCLLYTSRCV